MKKNGKRLTKKIIKKVVKRKGNKLFLKCKGYDNSFNG